MKIVVEIPARYGSKRVKTKNLRLMNGKPLVAYAIEAAKAARSVSEIFVNSESDEIGKIAKDYGVKYYKRTPELAGDNATSDQFNYDFMKNVESDAVVMVNPVAPLITGKDIDHMVDFFLNNEFDSIIPVKEEFLHAFCNNKPVNFKGCGQVLSMCDTKPVNFNPALQLPQTQKLHPVQLCVWTVCIWKTKVFKKAFEKQGHAVFSGNVGLYVFDKMKSVKISTEEDFVLAEILLKNENLWRIPMVQYDSQFVNEEYPIMWLSEIDAIQKLLLEHSKNKKKISVLEWGSGKSTVYFSKFLKDNNINFTWDAVENFVPWHKTVETMIANKGLVNVTKCHLKSATTEPNKDIQETLDNTEFLKYPSTIGKKYDFILIDARKRRECLEEARKILNEDGVVVLHDAERLDHRNALKLFKDGGRFICENRAPVPGGLQKLWAGKIK